MDLAHQIHSQRKLALLNDIDKLRSQGVNQFVDLPQLIVCGDQSSGKSSVLEAISGIPFPTKDTLCTRFATEVILRHSDESSIHVAILPDAEKSAEDQAAVSQFHHALSSFAGFAKLVDEAHECMSTVNSKHTFFKETLQIKVSGPNQPHLTIVDLPGLIHAESKQQTEADVDIVKEMVSQYMRQPRSIILAVVSAKNDIGNQAVLRLARGSDSHGKRTLGIITKPDELRPGSGAESEFIELAQNENIKFDLGWHVLRNRDYNERNSSSEERDEAERTFFQREKWRKLPLEIVGIDALRPRLSDILFEQIKLQLPDLVADIQEAIERCNTLLSKLGPSRATLVDQKQFLLELSEEFQTTVRAALNGVYDSQFFGDPLAENGEIKRLRAVVQNANMAFAEMMRKEGSHRRIVADEHEELEDLVNTVCRSDFIDEIRELLKKTRGRELPGMYNPLLVADIFHQQAQHWRNLALEHVMLIWQATKDFLEAVVREFSTEPTSDALLSRVIDVQMDKRRASMLEKVDELLLPYTFGHPITYNHYFVETVQKVREARRREDVVKHKIKYNPNSPNTADGIFIDSKALYSDFVHKTEADMDRHACTEILECMESFYKVALKSVIDNIAIYAIEGCLLRGLETLFSPRIMMRMEDEVISEIAAEPPQNARLREQSERKLKVLREGLATVRSHAMRKRQANLPKRAQSTSSDCKEDSSAADEPAARSRDSTPESARSHAPSSQEERRSSDDFTFTTKTKAKNRRRIKESTVDLVPVEVKDRPVPVPVPALEEDWNWSTEKFKKKKSRGWT